MILFEYNGQARTAKGLCDEFGVPYQTFKTRIKKGYTVEQALGLKSRVDDSMISFVSDSDVKSWDGLTMMQLFDKYSKWCIKKGYTAVSKSKFTHNIRSLVPTLETKVKRIKSYDGDHSVRVIYFTE